MAVNRRITVLPFKVDMERADWSKLAQAQLVVSGIVLVG